MQSMNISLPDPLKDFIEQQVASGRYSSVSEYVRELVREDEKRKARQKLEGLLLEGLQSGEAAQFTPSDWEEIRRQALARLESGKPRKRR